MNGHFIGGSRKLNKHWQSGKSSGPNWFDTGTSYLDLSWDSISSQYTPHIYIDGSSTGRGYLNRFVGDFNFAPSETTGFNDRVKTSFSYTSSSDRAGQCLKVTFKLDIPNKFRQYVKEKFDTDTFYMKVGDGALSQNINGESEDSLSIKYGGGTGSSVTTYNLLKMHNAFLENPPITIITTGATISTNTQQYYPIDSDGTFILYKPCKTSGFYTDNLEVIKIGIRGICWQISPLISIGTDLTDYTLYDGENFRIRYKTKYEFLSAEEWDNLKGSLYEVGS